MHIRKCMSWSLRYILESQIISQKEFGEHGVRERTVCCTIQMLYGILPVALVCYPMGSQDDILKMQI